MVSSSKANLIWFDKQMIKIHFLLNAKGFFSKICSQNKTWFFIGFFSFKSFNGVECFAFVVLALLWWDTINQTNFYSLAKYFREIRKSPIIVNITRLELIIKFFCNLLMRLLTSWLWKLVTAIVCVSG